MPKFLDRAAETKLFSSMSVLVVDDLLQIRDLVRSMLRSNGFTGFQMSDSGGHALAAIQSSRVDFVITDWNMPNMTGIELVKKIKEDKRFFSIPVLMISDEMTVDKVLYAIEEGVDGFILKPFSEATLVSNVKSIVARLAHPDGVEKMVYEMRLLKLSGDHRKALELGQEILMIRRHPRVVMMMSECLYQMKEYEQTVGMILDSDEEERTSEQTNLLGKAYMKLGKHKEGIECLEQAAKRNVLNHDRKIDLAQAYFFLGRRNDAERVMSSILSSNPSDLNLVDAARLYLDIGEVEKAGSCLGQTVEPIPETVHVFNTYGIALRKAGKYEESMVVYGKCLQIVPDSDVLHFNLGFLYAATGKLDDAKRTLIHTLKLNPDNQPAKDLLEKLANQGS